MNVKRARHLFFYDSLSLNVRDVINPETRSVVVHHTCFYLWLRSLYAHERYRVRICVRVRAKLRNALRIFIARDRDFSWLRQ